MPIPKELEEQKWPIKEDKFLTMLECLKAVDESLGKVLSVLQEEGELENTVVIFSSDNGYFMGEHTYHDKRIAYEASMRYFLNIMLMMLTLTQDLTCWPSERIVLNWLITSWRMI